MERIKLDLRDVMTITTLIIGFTLNYAAVDKRLTLIERKVDDLIISNQSLHATVLNHESRIIVLEQKVK